MKLTITGPRSVGKSTVSRILATKLDLKYIDGDAEMDQVLQDLGGLDRVMKDGLVDEAMERSVPFLKGIFQQDDFVFDLAGGATTPGKSATKTRSANENRATIKDSKVILLLPNRHEDSGIKTLQKREVQREHFLSMLNSGLTTARKVKLNARRHYIKNLPTWLNIADEIIYCDHKNPDEIADEIVSIVL